MQQLTKADLSAIEREFCSRSLANFAKRAWRVLEPSTDLKWGWALDAMCQHLEAVTEGHIKRLLMNVPPGTMKSLLTGVIWPAWEWGPKGLSHLRYLGTAHMQNLAVRDAMKCRRLIQSAWYQKHWPTQLVSDQNAKTKFENDKTGFREAMSFTSMTGSRGDRVILDDPLSVDQANSEAELYAASLTFTEALPSRVNNDDSAIVVIMQRLAEGDTSGIILDNDLGYVHLCLPMEFEPDRKCQTEIGFIDPRTEEGELLFPERFNVDQVEELKKSLSAVGGSYAVAGQLQQRPAPRGGGMFKQADFKSINEIPAGTKFVRGWDLAASTGQESAYTAGVKIGKTPDGRFIIAHVVRERASAGGVRNLIRSMASSDGPECMISIPQDPGQAGKAQAFDIKKEISALGYPIKSSPESGDKAVRATPLAVQVEIGNVYIYLGEWIKSFLDEVSVFPAGKFMDQVDAASRAFNELAQPQAKTTSTTVVGMY